MILTKLWKTIAIALIILIGSITSGSELNKIPFLGIHNLDKIIHFFMYFILTISLLSSLLKIYFTLNLNIKICSVLLTISYGLLMEFSQYFFTSDRSAEFLDIISNSLGAISGLIVFPIMVKLKLTKLL